MAFSTKYKGEFTDNEGEDWTVEILEDGYGGAVNTMQLAGVPLIIEWPSDNDDCFDQNIRGSSASIGVYCESDFQYSELFTSDNLEFKVYIYTGTGGGIVDRWHGWITSNVWNEPYSLIPYAITISATDGLGLLKDIDFADLSLTGRQTHAKIIYDTLSVIGFTAFTEYINVYESTMNATTSDSPLDQAGADVSLWDELTLYDTLTDILKMYNAAIIQYNGEMVLYRYKELEGLAPGIVIHMNNALIRNAEGDNLSESGDTTLIEITDKVGNVLTLNVLPEDLINTDIDWFVQSLDPSDYNVADPGYTGDYLVQDKITDFDFVNKKITLVDATDFDIGDNIAIYSPWANYDFVEGQESSGIITKSGSGWRSLYVASGPCWYDDINERYVILVNGRSASGYEIGYAYSTDLINWTIGNGDAPIIVQSDHTNFANNVWANGNIVDLGNGRIAFGITGYDSSNYPFFHIAEMDKDCTDISISDAILSGHKYFGGGLVYYEDKFIICVCNRDNANRWDWTAEMWECSTLTGTYSKVCDILDGSLEGNDSHWLEGAIDTFTPFVEDGKLYLFCSGTQRYIISGTRGNRIAGFMKYIDETETWESLNDFAPEILFPMYFYNISSEDYDWAGGHIGGMLSFLNAGETTYMFCSFTSLANDYQIGVLELDFGFCSMYGRTFTSATAKNGTTKTPAQNIDRMATPSNFIEHGGTLMIAPQVKELEITQDYHTKESILKNYDFPLDAFSGSWDVEDWTKSSGTTIVPLSTLKGGYGEDKGIFITNAETAVNHNIYQEVDYLVATSGDVVISFEYAAYTEESSPGGSDYVYAQVQNYEPGGTVYYMTATGSWTTTPTNILLGTHIATQYDITWRTKVIETTISQTGIMKILLYAGVNVSSHYINAFRETLVFCVNDDGAKVEAIEYNVTNAVNGQVVEKEYNLGDGDDFDNPMVMERGAVNVYDSGDEVASSRSWSTRGGSEADPVIELVGGETGNQFSRPKHILDLELYEQNNDFFDIIANLQDDLNQYSGSNRVFIINRATYYVKMRKWNLSLNELI